MSVAVGVQRILRRAAVAAALLLGAAAALAQSDTSTNEERAVGAGLTGEGISGTERLLRTPVTRLFPGDVRIDPEIENPAADDEGSAERGRRYFSQFNCSGCHAPNGGGGMGPSLSNAKFVYGGKPADIYLSILQGRPNGMPAWGAMLPEEIIWDLVSYIGSISKEPAAPWGKVTSRHPLKPSIEQVPAEYLTTTTPWRYTTKFGLGQRPFEKPKP